MTAAAESIEPDRLDRAFLRLQAHCELVGRLTDVDDPRPSARVRLERELGPDLARLLVAALTSSP
jgi:hypothetical protein